MGDFGIITQLNKRDREAFKYVFDTYYQGICLFIQKYVLDPDQAEDIAQDVFVSLWEKNLQFENLKAFKAYLYQTARNKSINALEHEAVKRGYQDMAIQEQNTEQFYNLNFIETETQRLIVKMLDKLPPRAREILHLQLEGYKNNEIAEKLNISVYTVKNHKATAYKFLKDNLQELIFLVVNTILIFS